MAREYGLVSLTELCSEHSVPSTPRPPTNDNYVIDDLASDDETDDEDNPRKKIPTWAEKQQLRAALVKQTYKPPNLANLFGIIEAPGMCFINSIYQLN